MSYTRLRYHIVTVTKGRTAAITPDVEDVMYPAMSLKTRGSRAVNKAGLLGGKFHWQRGYSAFTLNPLDLSGIIRYVANQKQHHANGTTRAAYERLG